jgi:hypothetical protein
MVRIASEFGMTPSSRTGSGSTRRRPRIRSGRFCRAVARAKDDPVTAYAASVANRQILTNRLVRLACERHLADLAPATARGLRFDTAAAEHAIDFLGFLRHSKGEWAGQTFVLVPWQAFVVGSLFGWKRDDGLRRFRIAYCAVPRKNGKSTLSAGIALYLLVAAGLRHARARQDRKSIEGPCRPAHSRTRIPAAGRRLSARKDDAATREVRSRISRMPRRPTAPRAR